MQIEPSFSADGSCNHWHYWRGDKLVGTLERTAKSKWTVILPNGIGPVYKTRRQAHAFILIQQ